MNLEPLQISLINLQFKGAKLLLESFQLVFIKHFLRARHYTKLLTWTIFLIITIDSDTSLYFMVEEREVKEVMKLPLTTQLSNGSHNSNPGSCPRRLYFYTTLGCIHCRGLYKTVIGFLQPEKRDQWKILMPPGITPLVSLHTKDLSFESGNE